MDRPYLHQFLAAYLPQWVGVWMLSQPKLPHCNTSAEDFEGNRHETSCNAETHCTLKHTSYIHHESGFEQWFSQHGWSDSCPQCNCIGLQLLKWRCIACHIEAWKAFEVFVNHGIVSPMLNVNATYLSFLIIRFAVLQLLSLTKWIFIQFSIIHDSISWQVDNKRR